MAIRKQYLKSRPVCKVTFRVSKEMADGARSINLVGDFNDWAKRSTPMKKHKNGCFSVAVDFDVDREYQFRYVRDNEIWKNEEDADRYEYSRFGDCENSVIVYLYRSLHVVFKMLGVL